MNLLLPDACLNTDILLATDRDTWVQCSKTRAKYGAVTMSIVIVIVMILVFIFSSSTKTKVLTGLIGASIIGLLFISIPLVGLTSGRAWDALRVEQDDLIKKDEKYKSWPNFIEYKRTRQTLSIQQQMANAQTTQANAQQNMAFSQMGNTALGFAQFARRH